MAVLGRTRKGDADGRFLEWVAAGPQEGVRDAQLAVGVMAVAVVLALIKARAEDKG
jgi:hypothetical protein